MATSVATAITATFPFPNLTPFASDRQPPTHASLLLLQREINANAMAVHSNSSGGLHGHLTLTVPPARYLVLAGASNAFAVPIARPPLPVIPVAATQSQISLAEWEHKEALRVFHRYHTTDKALVRAILATTPNTYVARLSDPDTGYGALSTLDVMNHLTTTYGTMTLCRS
jgi:hypothetical protein